METKRNIMIKVAGLFFLFLWTLNASAQTSQQVDPAETKRQHNVRLYFAPLSLTNPSGGSIQFTVGKSMWKNNEIQLSYSHRTSVGDPFLAYHFRLGPPSPYGTSFSSGFKIGAEIQQTIYKKDLFDMYLALEAAIGNDKININTTSYDEWLFFTDKAIEQFSRNSTYGNVKFGMKYILNYNILIDIYLGVGFKIDEYVGFNYTHNPYMTLPWNIKFGYQF